MNTGKKKNAKIAKSISDKDMELLLLAIGELIKEKIEPFGTLDDFAYETRVSRSTVTRLSSGRDMRLSNFLRMIMGAETDPADFFLELKTRQRKSKERKS